MKKRNPIAVALLPFVTFGIYGLYWSVKTKGEMVKLGAEIPTAWLILVPIVNWWWLYKYCMGVEKVTAGKLNGILAFVLIFVVGPIGAAIIQDSFNNNVAAAVGPILEGAPVAEASPTLENTTVAAETAGSEPVVVAAPAEETVPTPVVETPESSEPTDTTTINPEEPTPPAAPTVQG